MFCYTIVSQNYTVWGAAFGCYSGAKQFFSIPRSRSFPAQQDSSHGANFWQYGSPKRISTFMQITIAVSYTTWECGSRNLEDFIEAFCALKTDTLTCWSCNATISTLLSTMRSWKSTKSVFCLQIHGTLPSSKSPKVRSFTCEHLSWYPLRMVLFTLVTRYCPVVVQNLLRDRKITSVENNRNLRVWKRIMTLTCIVYRSHFLEWLNR